MRVSRHKPVDGFGTTAQLSTGAERSLKLLSVFGLAPGSRHTGFAARKSLLEKRKMRFSTESPVLY